MLTGVLDLGIVIPVFNEEEIIGRCLDSIINSIDYLTSIIPVKCDIIIVDDSSDKSKEIAIKYRYMNILQGNKKGISWARHIGTFHAIQMLGKDLIVSTDADITVPYDWLYKIYYHFLIEDVIAISGIYKEMNDRFYESIATTISNNIFIGLGGNMAFKREFYLISGGYNTCLKNGEDIDLWNRFKEFGKIIHDENIYVYHDSGYRWRAAIVYPFSILSIALGHSYLPLKILGGLVGGNELINHGDKLKDICYNG